MLNSRNCITLAAGYGRTASQHLSAEPDLCRQLWARPHPALEQALAQEKVNFADIARCDHNLKDCDQRLRALPHTPSWATNLPRLRTKVIATGIGNALVIGAQALGIGLCVGGCVGLAGALSGFLTDQAGANLLYLGFLGFLSTAALVPLRDTMRNKYQWLKSDLKDLSSSLREHRSERAYLQQQRATVVHARRQAEMRLRAHNVQIQRLQEAALRTIPPPQERG